MMYFLSQIVARRPAGSGAFHGADSLHARRSGVRAAVLLLSAVLASGSLAHAEEALTMDLSAAKRAVVVDAQGRPQETLVPVATILPGEEIIYTLVCENRGSAPAAGVVFTLPIPAETVFVADSAELAGAEVAYSVDGGKTFGRLEELTITEADGTVRPAQTSNVTTLQWALAGEIAPSQTLTARCRAILR